MTSSNKARRYLQNHKNQFSESNNSPQSVMQLSVADSTLSTSTTRKFKGKSQQSSLTTTTMTTTTVSIPQICVDKNDDDTDSDNQYVSILNDFDEVLENELKHTNVLRSLSLKKNDSIATPCDTPISQHRSFSFALGSKANQDEIDNDNNKTKMKQSLTSKSSLSKETFSRFFQSLTFRSGANLQTKLSIQRTDSSKNQNSCLACQNIPDLDPVPKNRKRPSIFGVFASKLNTSTNTQGNSTKCCPVCKRYLSKSISNKEDNHQSSPSKNLLDSTELFSDTKRRQSLPSLLHNLLEPSSSSSPATSRHRPSLSSVSNHALLDNVNYEQQQQQPSSTLSQSSSSLEDSDDSTDHQNINNNNSNNLLSPRHKNNFDHIFQLNEKSDNKDENDNEIIFDCNEPHGVHKMNSNESANESNTNQQFLHPPEEKTRNLLGNVFRTRRSNGLLDSSDANIVGKQLSASAINLATSIGIRRRNSAISTIQEATIDHRKYAVSEENLLSMDNTYIHFNNINGQTFKERLKYSTISENTTLREMLIKLFEKYQLSIDTYNICLRSAPTLPLSLDQPVKHLLLDDLVVTDMTHEDPTRIRRLSLCQHLSNALKFKRRSLGSNLKDYLVPSTLDSSQLVPPTPGFFWNCTLVEDDSPSNEDLALLSKESDTRSLSIQTSCSVNERTISYDDLVFMSRNDEEQVNDDKSKEIESSNRLSTKMSTPKEKTEKRNSIGSVILSLNSKSISKRLSTHCMMLDNDENQDSKSTNQNGRSSKSSRSSIFASSIFTRDGSDSSERSESNLSFIRRKCDEWLIHGLPKLAQLQFSIDECDLVIEKEWQPFIDEQSRTLMSEANKLQQEAIYEMLSTEVSYIRQILTMTDIFMTSVNILKSSQRDGIFNDIDMDKLFSNIQDVLHGNLLFWKEILLPIKVKLQQTGLPMNPSDLKNGFLKFDTYFKPYLHYVLDQKTSAEYFKQKFSRDDLFQYLINWIEANFTNRLSFSDLTIKPLQRLTRYKLLLEAIQKKTHDSQQRNDLQEMIQKVATFVNRVNSKLHSQEQEERVRQINDQIGPYEYVSAPPELTSFLQDYNRDSTSNRLNLLEDIPLFVRGYRRQIIQQGPMKMKDAKNSQDVYCYLFSDMFLITKIGKRSGSTNSSLSNMGNDGQSNRNPTIISNKILKPPIRIDRIDVREYDRRGGNSNSNAEPNTASFVAIIFSEYNLIESAYLFQTNLSKQWIENIRRTKVNFNLLMEESKIKYQTIHHPISSPSCSISSNTIHQSLPSLSLPLMELTSLTINETNPINEESRRSSKVESNVFKIVEQSRRNSRTDRKNFGRYFTADGTSTQGTTLSSPSPPIKQVLSSSATIIKRMSWNNDRSIEKNDSSLITNSFRSVHSSSGVSSTGSFLFSTDEDSSITTTSSSIPSIVPSIKNDEIDGKSSASTVVETDDQLIQSNLISEDSIKFNLEDKNNSQIISQLSPSSTSTLISNNQTLNESTTSITNDISSPETSLRRIPYPSVRKRNQIHYRSSPYHEQYHRSSESPDNNITIQKSHSPTENSSTVSSGNESDYDNNQSMDVKRPVNDTPNSNELTRTDDNIHNMTNSEQSDINKITSKDISHRANRIIQINTPATLDDSAPTSFQTLRKDSLTTRRLIDIRSHLLLNTTLDATEV